MNQRQKRTEEVTGQLPNPRYIKEDTESTQMAGVTSPIVSNYGSQMYRPVLICLSGELRGRRKSLSAPEISIGRSSKADWQIDDSASSRVHAKIVYENFDSPNEMPKCYVEDLDSRNGTELNGREVRGRMELKERDRLLVGSTVIGFFIRDDAEMRHDDSLYLSATRDMLTGLDNRRQLREHLRHHMARAERYRHHLCFFLMDLDFFKKINDQHGHDVGDEALCHVASLLKHGCRDSDLVARWGGEEFALCLPDTPPHHALRLAERLRSTIEHNPLEAEGLTISMTISVGGTVFMPGDDPERLFQRADQMLYHAKNQGRNRVEFPEGTEAENTTGA